MRRFSAVLDSTGAAVAPWVLNEPNCLGWELAFLVNKHADMQLATTIQVQDDWEQGGGPLVLGPFSTNHGGRLFAPFPSMIISPSVIMAGGLPADSSRIRMVATPVFEDGWSQASSVALFGASGPINAGATQIVPIPDAALRFKVTLGRDGGPWNLSLETQANPLGNVQTSFWEVTQGGQLDKNESGQGWQEVPCPSAFVSVENTGLAASTFGVWWEFDFRKLK